MKKLNSKKQNFYFTDVFKRLNFNNFRKAFHILSLCTVFFLSSSFLFSETEADTDILMNGKWYNDEYSFNFYKNNTFKSYYTSGARTGELKGNFKIKGNKIFLSKINSKGKYEDYFVKNKESIFLFKEDLKNPKSTRYLTNADGTIVLWNDKSFVPAGTKVAVGSENISCIAMGNELSSTTDNVRIRKGPGIDYDYMQFTYKDVKNNEVKTFGSVLAGTNIRILAKTSDKMKVNQWYNNWYYVEYKEPLDNFIVYKTAWMFGEFINVAENKERHISIEYPENEDAIYGGYDLVVEGTVTGAPVKMIIQIKNSYGNVISEEEIQDYNQEEGTFQYVLSKNDTLFIGSNTCNIISVYSDKKRVSKQVTFYLHESEGEMAKPVIYLYPEKKMNVKVEVKPENGISVSIPEYNSGWNVSADTDGNIINLSDNKTYLYLFWESENYPSMEMKTGFVVEKEKLKEFFEEKLKIMGLNEKEISDFTEFWIPELNKKPYYMIYFFTSKQMEKYAPLKVTPRPDTVIRVFFDSKGLDAPVTIKPQKLRSVKRKGFTVVEWGGMRY
ncbi:MAG: hypothetical protein JW982_09430 [Spirochaetes bacterium]|nr:hypothetical protein [Spirochaetota bacterium]